jgi:outer membrane protein assembly factor BamB
LLLGLVCVTSACAPASTADVWQLRTHRPFLAGDSEAFAPAVHDGAIFFCGGYAYTNRAELFRLRAADGSVQWRVPMQACAASPAVTSDNVLIAFGTEGHTPAVILHGIDGVSGVEHWRRRVGEIRFHELFGQSLLLVLADGSVLRVDAADGRVQTLAVAGLQAHRPWLTLVGGRAIVGSGDRVWEMSPDSGDAIPAVRLRAPTGDVVAATADDDLLVMRAERDVLEAFDRSSGRQLWRREWPRLLSAPALGNGKVFINTFGPNRYELHAIDARSGRELWSVMDGSFEKPTLSDGRVYAAGRSSVFVADSATGAVVQSVRVSREVISSPVVFGGQMLFGTIDGVLHARHAPTFTDSQIR